MRDTMRRVLVAVLVGDVRRRGVYTPIMRDVLSLEGQLGQLRSIIIKAQHNCVSDRKSYGKLEDVLIKHEYCVIFKKPQKTQPLLMDGPCPNRGTEVKGHESQ